MTTHHNTQSLQGNNHNGNKAITLDDIRSALMDEFHFSTSLKVNRPGDTQMALTAEQARALVIGLPWQRLGEYESIVIL